MKGSFFAVPLSDLFYLERRKAIVKYCRGRSFRGKKPGKAVFTSTLPSRPSTLIYTNQRNRKKPDKIMSRVRFLGHFLRTIAWPRFASPGDVKKRRKEDLCAKYNIKKGGVKRTKNTNHTQHLMFGDALLFLLPEYLRRY